MKLLPRIWDGLVGDRGQVHTAAPVAGSTPVPDSEPSAASTVEPADEGPVALPASPTVEALIAVRDDLRGAIDGLDPAAGRVLVRLDSRLREILALEQVVAIEDEGPFDPERHAAVSGLITDDPAQDQHIASTVRPGYTRHGTLVRRQDVLVYRLRGTTPR